MPGLVVDERRPAWVPACYILQHPRLPLLQRLLGTAGPARGQQLTEVLTLQDLQDQMRRLGVSGDANSRNMREVLARWVCGEDSNWVPCWACQEKICDVCKISKVLTPPQTKHECYPRCEVCFSLHVEDNAALPTCLCLPDSRPAVESIDSVIIPREICRDCASRPDYVLLDMRRQWEISQGYTYPDRVWCCDCGLGQEEGQMSWSCDRCSGQCFDMIHVPSSVPW